MKHINWHAVGIVCIVISFLAFVCAGFCSADKAVMFYIAGTLEFIAGGICGCIGEMLYQ